MFSVSWTACLQLTQLSEHNVHISAEVDQLINDKSALEEVVKALMGEIRAVRVQQGDYKWVAPLPTQDVGQCTAPTACPRPCVQSVHVLGFRCVCRSL